MSKNKQRIELRGAIVPADYDDEWLDSYINRGCFTPESRIRTAFKNAEASQSDVELYVSSQGGCVVSGNEILATFHSYPFGKSITVGSFAASMAANIILQGGVKVKAHKNTMFLFHGAYTWTVGGSEAHADTTKFLDQINGQIKAALLAKGVPANVVNAGFAEGRMLTMTAAEAKKYGIVDEIIGEDAPPVARLKKEDEDALVAQGTTLNVAACSKALDLINNKNGDVKMSKVKTKAEEIEETDETTEETTTEETTEETTETETTEETTEENPDEETTEETSSEETEETTEETEEEDASAEETEEEIPEDGGQAKAMLTRLRAEMKAKQKAYQATLAKNKKAFDAMKAEYESFRAQAKADADKAAKTIEDLNAEVTRVTDLHAQVTGGALQEHSGGQAAKPRSWEAAVKEFGHVVAMQKFPGLAKAYRESKQAAKKA